MPVLTRSDFITHHLPGTTFCTLATPGQGAADVRVWRVEIEPGTEPVPHSLTRAEVFVVESGAAHVTIGSATMLAHAGEVIVVPANTDFMLQVSGDAPFVAVVCFPLEGQAVMSGKQPFTPPWGA